jgi:hypothetical protein
VQVLDVEPPVVGFRQEMRYGAGGVESEGGGVETRARTCKISSSSATKSG